MTPVKVLLADDNSSILRILISVARELGCETITATDGADALLKIQKAAPDLVVADFSMPILNGVQLFRKMKESPTHRGTPYLLLATRDEMDHEVKTLEGTPDEWIQKPFFAAEVKQRLRSILSRLPQVRLDSLTVKDGVISGRLADMSPVDLIQALGLGQKTCALKVQSTGDPAVLYFRDGEIYDAERGSERGPAVVFDSLTWTEGQFQIDFDGVSPQHSVGESTQSLLMEGLRRLDESKRI
ncbi:MAG: response regulator [Acidobacteriia bacterium]|nr:response regulator [Terriglobia bacterium]